MASVTSSHRASGYSTSHTAPKETQGFAQLLPGTANGDERRKERGQGKGKSERNKRNRRGQMEEKKRGKKEEKREGEG